MSAEHDPAHGSEEAAPAPKDDFLDRPVEPASYTAESRSDGSQAVEAPRPTAPDVPAEPAQAPATSRHAASPNMLPGRESRRSLLERMVVRLIATCGIVGIGVAIAAIMVSSKSQGWVVGLVVSIVSVVLAALLWSSKQL